MRVTHELNFEGVCPVDEATDKYALTVSTRRLIPVEEILKAVEIATERPAYQEGITAGIRASLPRADEVKTVCRHSGVLTTVVVA